jgi:hypothetical protein
MFYLSLLYGLSFATQHIDSCINFEENNHCIHIEVKDTIDTQKSASYLFLHVEINYGNKIKNKYYHTRKGITFPKVNSPFISSYISALPADRVYTSQLINYIYIACVQYSEL